MGHVWIYTVVQPCIAQRLLVNPFIADISFVHLKANNSPAPILNQSDTDLTTCKSARDAMTGKCADKCARLENVTKWEAD